MVILLRGINTNEPLYVSESVKSKEKLHSTFYNILLH